MNNKNESDVNAVLISAAPDLLAALIDCVAVMDAELKGLAVIQPELRHARSAIAKTTANPTTANPMSDKSTLSDDAFEDIGQSMIDHTRAQLLSECGRAQIGFAFDDSGALEIRAGEETLRLSPPTVTRLARFLDLVSA